MDAGVEALVGEWTGRLIDRLHGNHEHHRSELTDDERSELILAFEDYGLSHVDAILVADTMADTIRVKLGRHLAEYHGMGPN